MESRTSTSFDIPDVIPENVLKNNADLTFCVRFELVLSVDRAAAAAEMRARREPRAESRA